MVAVFVSLNGFDIVCIAKASGGRKLIVGMIEIAKPFEHFVFGQGGIVRTAKLIEHSKTDTGGDNISSSEIIVIADKDENGHSGFLAVFSQNRKNGVYFVSATAVCGIAEVENDIQTLFAAVSVLRQFIQRRLEHFFGEDTFERGGTNTDVDEGICHFTAVMKV